MDPSWRAAISNVDDYMYILLLDQLNINQFIFKIF